MSNVQLDKLEKRVMETIQASLSASRQNPLDPISEVFGEDDLDQEAADRIARAAKVAAAILIEYNHGADDAGLRWLPKDVRQRLLSGEIALARKKKAKR